MLDVKTMSVTELKQRLLDNSILLVDVREPHEFAAGAIDGAVNLPLSSFSNSLATVTNEANKEIVIYCHSGQRSQQAAKILLAANSELTVYNLIGGIVSWQREEKSTASLAPVGKPLTKVENQQQVIIGSVILIAAMLSFILPTVSLVMTMFIGLGLIRNGVTGVCYLNKFLAKLQK